MFIIFAGKNTGKISIDIHRIMFFTHFGHVGIRKKTGHRVVMSQHSRSPVSRHEAGSIPSLAFAETGRLSNPDAILTVLDFSIFLLRKWHQEIIIIVQSQAYNSRKISRNFLFSRNSCRVISAWPFV